MLTRLAAVAIATATLATATPALAQTAAEDARFEQAKERFDREYQVFRQEADRYQAARTRGGPGGYRPAYNSGANPPPRLADPRYDSGYDDEEAYYDPAPDYRAGGSYRERVLSNDERVYRGTDGRYYCRRSDGTTGLIVGGAAGGVLGNVIDGGRSRTVGTLLGAAVGALAGRAVERQNQEVRCR